MRPAYTQQIVGLSTVSIVLVVFSTAFRSSSGSNLEGLSLSLLAAGLALLVPIGFALLASGGFADERAALMALMGTLAISAAVVGYLLTGFAFQFGGVGLVSSIPGLKDLIWEWSFLDTNWGLGWGMLGLRGFALGTEASNPDAYVLFFSQVAPVATAVLLPLLALRGRAKPLVLLAAAVLVSMFVYPVAGNWIMGGGWLANLGVNMSLGHGFVDFAGAGLVHLLGATVALAGLVVFSSSETDVLEDQPVRMPPAHLPIFTVLGSFVVLPGVIALALSNPLVNELDVSVPVFTLNMVLAAAGGALLALLYSWFATGTANIYMTARGWVCGLIAISAVCPFVAPWLALLIGAFAGLLLPFMSYVFTCSIRLSDRALIVPIHGISAVWGLLAVGLFANGRYGQGWNSVGIEEFLGVKGQGVTGILTTAGIQPDATQQLYAQLIGIAAIGVFSFVISWVIFKILSLLSTAAEDRITEENIADNHPPRTTLASDV